jgi:hypothetical protein
MRKTTHDASRRVGRKGHFWEVFVGRMVMIELLIVLIALSLPKGFTIS